MLPRYLNQGLRIIGLMLLICQPLYSQQASAEYISEAAPGKLQSGEQVQDGIQGVFYADGKLFVTNIWSGLQILDVSRPEKPKELATVESLGRVRSVVVQGNYAILATELNGVTILDITNPSAPRQAGIIQTAGDAIWAESAWPLVYVAMGKQGIAVYNCENPEAPQLLSTYTDVRWAWGMELTDHLLLFADKQKGIGILDVSDPAAIKLAGSYPGGTNAMMLQVENNLAYVAYGPAGLIILDIKNPAYPTRLSQVQAGGFVNSVYKFGNNVFLANEQLQELQIVDVTNPASPVLQGSYQAESKVYAAWKQNVNVYVAADKKTLILRHNHPPVIQAIADQSVDEMQLLNILPSAEDADGDAIFFSVENLPEGAVFDSTSGKINWQPDYVQSGLYPNVEIRVTERTSSALSASASFNVKVNHVNRLPSLPAIADTFVSENQTLVIKVPQGSDPDTEDKGKLTYTADNLPEGAAFDPKLRVFTFKPGFEQSGVFAVDFAVHDAAGGVVHEPSTITVKHVDRKPELAVVPAQAVAENSLLEFKLSGSDQDTEDQSKLSYKAENLPEGAVFDPVSATFRWTPTYFQSGVYEKPAFIFTAGNMADTVIVPVTVNHVNLAPVLTAISAQTVDEDKTLSFIISGSDTDPEDAGKLVYTAQNLPQGAVFNADSLKFTWHPTYEQSGEYGQVTFRVADASGLSAEQTALIRVNHVNRIPMMTAPAPVVVNENEALTVVLQGSDPDQEDQGKLEYTARNLPQGSVLTANSFSWTPAFDQSGTYTVEFTVSDGRLKATQNLSVTVNHVNRAPQLEPVLAQTVNENLPLSFKLTGSDPDKEDTGLWKLSSGVLPMGVVFDAASGNFNWTPGFEQSGVYNLTFTNTDPSGLTASVEVPVTVVHVNRTPVLPVQPAQTVDENSPLEFTIVPSTDPDQEDKGKLTYTADNLPQGAVFDAAAGVVKWTPTYEQSGTYTVNMKVKDAEFEVVQPVTITVNHINRVPVLNPVTAQTAAENQAWMLKADYSDPDKEDQGKLEFSASGLPEGASFDESTANFSWTPSFEQSGSYENISVTVTDAAGLQAVQSFALTVNNVNRAPQLQPVGAQKTNENQPLTISLSASDPDREDEGKLQFTAANLPQGAAINSGSGEISWTPNFLQSGSYNFTVTVRDAEGLSAEQSVSVTVTEVNREPKLENPGQQSVKENEALNVRFSASDEDTDNTLNYSASGLPAGASLDENSGELSWKPGFDQAGSYSVTVTVSDGASRVAQSVKIEVENVNRAPKIEVPGGMTVTAGENVSFTVSARDEDKDKLEFEISGEPSGAGFSNGHFSWTPGDEQSGTFNLKFTVSDGTDRDSGSVTVTVNPKPQPEPVQENPEQNQN